MFRKFFDIKTGAAPLVKSTGSIGKADMLRALRESYFPCELIRIGAPNDGGYLVPDIFEGIRYCFSAGVGDVVDVERQLVADYGIECFLCDGSIDKLPEDLQVASFAQKFLRARSGESDISLREWINECLPEHNGELFLQMDIEGGEYEVLAYESASVLNEFAVMVIEFHNLQDWACYTALQMVSGVFEKILEGFVICHIHPNNCGGAWRWEGVLTPCVIEITFVNRRLLSALREASGNRGAHALDAPNDPLLDAVELPLEWYSLQ